MPHSSLRVPPARKYAAESKQASNLALSLQPSHSEDLPLAHRIECALRRAGYRVLHDIEVRVEARGVRLVGCVPTYFLKQIAQVTAGAVPGAPQIQNDLAVVPQG